MAEGRRCERNRDTALRSYYKRKAEEQRLTGQVRQLGALQRHSWLGLWECSNWCLTERANTALRLHWSLQAEEQRQKGQVLPWRFRSGLRCACVPGLCLLWVSSGCADCES